MQNMHTMHVRKYEQHAKQYAKYAKYAKYASHVLCIYFHQYDNKYRTVALVGRASAHDA